MPPHLKLALIVNHCNRPFTLEIERFGTLKSSIQRLRAFGLRRDSPEPLHLPFQPEEDNSILDDIDLEALTSIEETDSS
jgi:hypothetical protein